MKMFRGMKLMKVRLVDPVSRNQHIHFMNLEMVFHEASGN
jgi:hypothetical protein